MKISFVIDAPKWSAKDADFFADLISKMLFDHTAYTLDKPAFLADYDYKAERAKKRKAKKSA